MGLIMGFSSLVGLGADFILPQILKGITVKKLMTRAILASITCSLLLLIAIKIPIVIFLLGAMAAWGIYYELIAFSNHQLVATYVPKYGHASAWGWIMMFNSISDFIGPMLAVWLIAAGSQQLVLFAMSFTLIALFIALATKRHHDRPLEVELHHINFGAELKKWASLSRHVWQILILSLTLGIIDSVFWTTGTVWSEALSQQNFWGGMLLPFYSLPSIPLGLFLAKKKIISGKKKYAEILTLIAGLTLMSLTFINSLAGILLIILLSSILLSIAFPLADAVYSDIIARMGKQDQHLIGLSNSTFSIAYIIGPVLAGLTAQFFGEQKTFAVLGLVVTLISAFLLLTTPKKLKLPQTEIREWN
jgi:MFS family permease